MSNADAVALHRYFDFLGVRGVRKFPTELDMARVIPVIDISPASSASITWGIHTIVSDPLVGLATRQHNIVNRLALTPAAFTNIEDDVVILGLHAEIIFDAAGATAFNLNKLDFDLGLKVGVGSSALISHVEDGITVQTGVLTYKFGWGPFFNAASEPTSWHDSVLPLFVPKAAHLHHNVYAPANFPANTTMNTSVVLGFAPPGTRLPGVPR